MDLPQVRRFSVLLAVYDKDNPAHLAEALASIAWQTRKDFELVVVLDGPCGDSILSVLDTFQLKFGALKIVELPVNLGLNLALNEGLKHCAFDMVVRCDADDISYPSRFEKLIGHLENNRHTSIIGSSVLEFETSKTGPIICKLRSAPATPMQIRRMARYRSPFNHPAVAYRKSDVEAAGCYPVRQDTRMEDYGLWLNMLSKGMLGFNLSKPLLLFRAGPGMLTRRAGLRYARDEISFYKIRRDAKIASWPLTVTITLIRATLRLVPPKILGLIYKIFLRVAAQNPAIINEAEALFKNLFSSNLHTHLVKVKPLA